MDAQVVAAYVTGGFGILLALVGIFIGRDAKNAATRAEEAAKRVEQVRLKATEAGEKLLAAFADLIVPSETILFFLDKTPNGRLDDPSIDEEERGTIEEEIMMRYQTISDAVGQMRKTMYASALYTTEEIRSQVEETLAPFHAGGVPFTSSDWEAFVNELRQNHSELVKLFYGAYLKGSI